MLRPPNLTASSLRWLGVLLLAAALWPVHARAQAIDRGREAEVLALLRPFVDDGPVGDGTLRRIAIRPDAVALDIVDAAGQRAALQLTLRLPGDAAPGTKSFAIKLLPAPTPQLAQAQQLLRAAVEHNDDGGFLARSTALPAHAQAANPDTRGQPALWSLATALWLALLGLLLCRAVRDRSPLKWLFWLTFALLATLVRRHVAFAPLHANGHGLEEILVAIGDPDARMATARFASQYGAAWLTPLRALTRLLGATHDQLAVISSALGGLAAAFATAAAWRLSRQWLWTALAAALAVFAPVAMRVGHSESTFVVAQLLVALGLWLATHPRPGPNVALAAVLALLALGHPVGIGLALGVYLLALAVALEDAGLRQPLRHLWPLLALALAAAVQLATTHAGVADRLTFASQLHIPVPTLPHEYWLWLQPGYAPRLAVLAGAAGLWSFGRVFQDRGRWLVFGLAAFGVLAVALTGLLVTACVTDGLRYQAPFAPVLAVLVARAGQGLAGTVTGRVLAIALWLGIAFGFGNLRAGRELDAQGQSYVDLRQSLQGLSGDVWLVAPDRAEGHERVVVQLPAGRLAPDGVTLRTLLAEDVRSACQAGTPLPKQAFVWLDHACGTQMPNGSARPCAQLLPLAGETVRSFHVLPLPPPGREGMAGEFNVYPPGAVEVRLARVRCP